MIRAGEIRKREEVKKRLKDIKEEIKELTEGAIKGDIRSDLDWRVAMAKLTTEKTKILNWLESWRECKRCWYQWIPREFLRNYQEEPIQCPRCRSASWMTPRYGLQCKRCGHRWAPFHLQRKQKNCPCCGSWNWMKENGKCQCENIDAILLEAEDRGKVELETEEKVEKVEE